MQTTNFWDDALADLPPLASSDDLPERVDVAVIGGGYTGLSAARTLAMSGASVAVLERHTIGWGASSRNGGMATSGLKKSTQRAFAAYGEAKGRELWQAALDAVHLVEAIVREEQIDCDWHMDGYCAVAYKESHFESMQTSARWHNEKLGYETHIVSRDELASEIGSPRYFGAVTGGAGAGLQPAKYVRGLAEAAARHGACLCPQTPVTGVEQHNGTVRLTTARGILHARDVIVATNGYTDSLVRRINPKVFPVGSYIIVTEPLDSALQDRLSPKRRMFYDSKWFINYFRLTADGRLLWGGRNNLDPNLDLVQSVSILRAQMVAAFPDLADVAVTHSWTGRLGITFDLVPHIGYVDGVHFALGYGGHGLALATYLGREIGQMLSGEKTRSPFAEIPHQTWFFYRRKAWFLPLAALWYRFLDAVS